MSCSTVHAALSGSDNATDSAYDGPGFWQNGDDGGTPGTFGAWSLTNGGAQSGRFIGDSTTLNPGNTGANINISGESFGMFAHSGQTSNAFRDFNGNTLGIGETFSFDMAVNFRNGHKGFVLRNSADADIFTFNIGSNDYVVSNAATGNGSIGSTYSSNTEFALLFTQTTLAGGTWSITRSGGVSDSDSGTYSGVAENFIFYNSNTTGGGAAQDNLYFNNLTVVPEPTGALVAMMTAGCFFLRRRRR